MALGVRSSLRGEAVMLARPFGVERSVQPGNDEILLACFGTYERRPRSAEVQGRHDGWPNQDLARMQQGGRLAGIHITNLFAAVGTLPRGAEPLPPRSAPTSPGCGRGARRPRGA